MMLPFSLPPAPSHSRLIVTYREFCCFRRRQRRPDSSEACLSSRSAAAADDVLRTSSDDKVSCQNYKRSGESVTLPPEVFRGFEGLLHLIHTEARDHTEVSWPFQFPLHAARPFHLALGQAELFSTGT